MTLREKRHREVMNTLNRTVAQRDGCLANLVRYEARIKTLRRQAQRLEKAMAQPAPAKPVLRDDKDPPLSLGMLGPLPPPSTDLTIPDFLQRPKQTDTEIAAELKQQQAERKIIKSRVRIEKMKAKQSGETRRMPLSGKAALAAIRAQ